MYPASLERSSLGASPVTTLTLHGNGSGTDLPLRPTPRLKASNLDGRQATTESKDTVPGGPLTTLGRHAVQGIVDPIVDPICPTEVANSVA